MWVKLQKSKVIIALKEHEIELDKGLKRLFCHSQKDLKGKTLCFCSFCCHWKQERLNSDACKATLNIIWDVFTNV